VAKVGTPKAGGAISQQAAGQPWLAHGHKQTTQKSEELNFLPLLAIKPPFLSQTVHRSVTNMLKYCATPSVNTCTNIININKLNI
jgi:hypothetical protein